MFNRPIAAFIAATALLFLRAAPAVRADDRPNILVIVADDQGYADIACQGCKDIPTPNIDAFGAAGVRFTSGYVSAPVCCPSRAGILTGRYPERWGQEENPPFPIEPNFGLPLAEETIATAMQDAGYSTACIGKWHEGMREELRPLHRGFDYFMGFLHGQHSYVHDETGDFRIFRQDQPIPIPGYLTDAFTDEAIKYINEHKNKPFFVYLAYNAVHWPLDTVEKYESRFTYIADIKRRKHAACVAGLDEGVGKVMADLKEQGLDKNTLVFYISDNGGPTRQTTSSNTPLRAGKGSVYEGGIRTPNMMQWPGHIPAGKVDDRPVISLDIAATTLGVTGAKLKDPSLLDGVNLMPYLTGKKTGTPHSALFWLIGGQHAERMGDWKFVDIGKNGEPELYNLADDISETKNLAPENPAKLKELQTAYAAWNKDNAPSLWHDNYLQRKAAGKENDGNDGAP